MARKQQKLLGFGPRWQTADPTESLTREHEVQEALHQLEEVYRKQRQVQDHGNAECAADFQPTKQRAVLTRRRGQTVESFGKREDGEWVLEPEEMLYLAERGTLAVSEEVENGKRRRLAIPELYSQVLTSPIHLDADSYMVYSHLRRSGYTVTRSTEKSDLQKQLWHVAASAADCPSEVLVVRPDETVLQCLLGQTAKQSWEGRVSDLHARVAKGLGVAVSAAEGGSPAFLELLAPRRPGEEEDSGQGAGAASASSDSEEASNEGNEGSRLPLPSEPSTSQLNEEALEPRQRYAAMLQRIAQIAAPASEAPREKGSKPMSSKSKDTQDAWLL